MFYKKKLPLSSLVDCYDPKWIQKYSDNGVGVGGRVLFLETGLFNHYLIHPVIT